MRTPAGLPCRVMRISSDSARRRKRDRSSFTSASAPRRIGRPVLGEPARGLGLRDDGEDFDGLRRDVIEYTDLPNTRPILWLSQASQPLDAALADTGWLMAQVPLERIAHLGAPIGRQR